MMFLRSHAPSNYRVVHRPPARGAGGFARAVASHAARREIFRQLLAADSVRLRSGDLPQREITKAELELARVDAELLRAAAQVHASRLALQLQMGIAAPDTAFRVAGDLAYQPVIFPEDSLAVLAERRRPDLVSARERTAQSEAIEHMAATLWIPTPELTYSYQHGGQFARG